MARTKRVLTGCQASRPRRGAAPGRRHLVDLSRHRYDLASQVPAATAKRRATPLLCPDSRGRKRARFIHIAKPFYFHYKSHFTAGARSAHDCHGKLIKAAEKLNYHRRPGGVTGMVRQGARPPACGQATAIAPRCAFWLRGMQTLRNTQPRLQSVAGTSLVKSLTCLIKKSCSQPVIQ